MSKVQYLGINVDNLRGVWRSLVADQLAAASPLNSEDCACANQAQVELQMLS